MPRYLIERDLPGAGQLSARDRQAIAIKSNRVLNELGISWQHSYVTDGHIHCVYIAPNEEIVREHAQRGEFPVTRIFEVETIMDPATAENGSVEA